MAPICTTEGLTPEKVVRAVIKSTVNAHSHRARLRPSTSVARRASRASTSVDARLRRYGTHAKRPASSHQAHLRPSMDVNAFKIEHGSILSASTPVDGNRHTRCERAGLLACVPYRRRRASTDVDVCQCASTNVDGRRRARCEWALKQSNR